jgi:glyoxylase-like metal-dependent hydrolase (beta-lactamase superfamily II)
MNPTRKVLWWIFGGFCFMGAASVSAQTAAWTPVKSIDFSAKHAVLIQNDDKTLTPMDVPYFQSKLIAPGTWQILNDGDYCYLLEGDNEAIAIDTGYGAGNLREYCQTLTAKPVKNVINTHSHFDHTAGDAYFDRVFMSKLAQPLATIPYASFAGITFPRNYPVTIVGDGFHYDLGNRDLEVFEVGNHTLDGIAILDRSRRILFAGDEVMGTRMSVSVSVERFAERMQKLAAHSAEFDTIAGGPGIYEGSLVGKYAAAAKALLEGKPSQAVTANPSGWTPTTVSESAPAGAVVYVRHGPHAGDGGARSDPSTTVIQFNWNGCTLSYDTTKLRG